MPKGENKRRKILASGVPGFYLEGFPGATEKPPPKPKPKPEPPPSRPSVIKHKEWWEL